MLPRIWICVGFAFVILSVDVAAGVAQENDSEKVPQPGKRGAYSVLSWLTGMDETEDARPSQRRIATERPDFSYATTTVGKGRVVLETGYAYFHDNFLEERSLSHEFPQALLRFGLFTEWFEIQIGQGYSDSRVLQADGSTIRESGWEDLFIGVKLGLTSQDKWLPESSLLVGITTPTGSRELTNRHSMPSIYYTYAWGFLDDKIALCGTSGVAQFLEVETHDFTQMLQTAEVVANLTPNLTGYFEYAAFLPYNAIEEKPQHIVNSGLLYFLNDNIQLDVYGGIGLSRAAPDYFVGAGFSIRH